MGTATNNEVSGGTHDPPQKHRQMEVATITGHKDFRMLRRHTHLKAEDYVTANINATQS